MQVAGMCRYGSLLNINLSGKNKIHLYSINLMLIKMSFLFQNDDIEHEIRVISEKTHKKKNGRKLAKRKKSEDLIINPEDVKKFNDMLMDEDLQFFVNPLETKRVKKNPGMPEK